MKVNFMIIGAQKTATTSLFAVLNAHPLLEGCKGKEPDFFSLSKNWKNELDRYEKLYAKKENVLYFEASPSYTFYPYRNLKIWDDIYEYNPEMKFIYIVRNPIQRVISSYMHSYERGYTDFKIREALIKNPFYIDITRYATQITPYINKFGREKVLIIDFDDLISENELMMKKIGSFLGVDYRKFGNFGQTRMNTSLKGYKRHHKWDNPPFYLRLIKKRAPKIWKYITDNSSRSFRTKPELDATYKEMIINVLSLEIDALEKLMGKSLKHWRTPGNTREKANKELMNT